MTITLVVDVFECFGYENIQAYFETCICSMQMLERKMVILIFGISYSSTIAFVQNFQFCLLVPTKALQPTCHLPFEMAASLVPQAYGRPRKLKKYLRREHKLGGIPC